MSKRTRKLTCPACIGSGLTITEDEPCPTCGGTGAVSKREWLKWWENPPDDEEDTAHEGRDCGRIEEEGGPLLWDSFGPLEHAAERHEAFPTLFLRNPRKVEEKPEG